MDFARLPDTIFLKIFNYLPLENRVRAGRVNKSFRRISQLATSLTTSLDLTQNRFKELDADQLAVLLDLCSRNLAVIKFPYTGDMGLPLVTTFADYECPRLIDIDIVEIPIDKITFGRLIRNCPKLESLYWDEVEVVEFPDVVNNNLKTLGLETVSDGVLESLIGQCPNLKDLYLVMENATADVLDRFFSSVPQLKEIYFRTLGTNIAFESLVHMWKLPITSLNIAVISNPDSVLQKVAASFPHLQTLRMYAKNASDNGIGSLGTLRDLETLYLEVDRAGRYDQGVRQLSHCKNLKKLEIYSSVISGSTLVTLFRSCSRLKFVAIPSIHEVDTPEQAAVVLGSLSGMAKRDIAIGFYPFKIDESDEWLRSIWETEPVKDMIKMLEENEGLKIEVDIF